MRRVRRSHSEERNTDVRCAIYSCKMRETERYARRSEQLNKRDGMKLNKKNTKITCNDVVRRRLRRRVMIDEEQLEEVTEYKYLGRLVTSGNDITNEIGQRIILGWRRFGEYSIDTF